MAASKKEVFTRYPLTSVILYNGVTALHFALGAFGIYRGFAEYAWALWLALGYLAFAFGQMYVLMPVRVCPNCPYYRLEGARCISALNLLARRITYQGKPQRFKRRARGPLCHNNLYLAALLLPVPLMVAGLVVNFSAGLLAALAAVVGLMVFRVLVLFMRVACPHCHAKQRCPNAEQMGIA